GGNVLTIALIELFDVLDSDKANGVNDKIYGDGSDMKGEMAALSIDGVGDKAWQVDLDEEANEKGIYVLWIQVNDLLASLMFERMVKQVGDFLGQFLDYDAKPISLGYCSYMRFKVRIHVRNLLKRTKKIVLVNKISMYARFQYERISVFCFLYGQLGHLRDFANQNYSRKRRIGI
ncbi:hypothetical protein Golob_018221, partial [Gossypium lobatum]|nr:hypothetical protein [Gossypium lobatum]